MNIHVMLAALAGLAQRPRSPAEFAYRDDQRLVEQRLARRAFRRNGIEGVNLAHPAINVNEEDLARRSHRPGFFFSADIVRMEGVEITADQTYATDAKEFAASKRWYITLAFFHGL